MILNKIVAFLNLQLSYDFVWHIHQVLASYEHWLEFVKCEQLIGMSFAEYYLKMGEKKRNLNVSKPNDTHTPSYGTTYVMHDVCILCGNYKIAWYKCIGNNMAGCA